MEQQTPTPDEADPAVQIERLKQRVVVAERQALAATSRNRHLQAVIVSAHTEMIVMQLTLRETMELLMMHCIDIGQARQLAGKLLMRNDSENIANFTQAVNMVRERYPHLFVGDPSTKGSPNEQETHINHRDG